MTFRELSERRTAGRIAGIMLEIFLPGMTLFLSNRDMGIDLDPVIASFGDFSFSADGEAGAMKTPDFRFTVLNKRLSFQIAGKRFSDLFLDYTFLGILIRLTWRLKDEATGIWYNHQSFCGLLEEPKIRPLVIEFNAVGGTNYDAFFPPRLFRKEDTGMERLPDDTIGTPIPVIFGDWWDTTNLSGINPEDQENLGITRNAVPILLYDPFDGTTKSHKYRATSHACHTVQAATADGVFLYERDIDTLASLELGLGSIENNVGGVDVLLTRPIYAEAFIRPATSVYDYAWQNLCDRDETTYVDIVYGNEAFVKMDPAPDLGPIIAMKIAAIVQVTVASDVNLLIGCWSNFPTASEATPYTANPAWGNPAYISRTVSTAALKSWNLTDVGGGPLCIFVKFDVAGTVGTVRVFEMCVMFQYIPKSLKGIKDVMPRTGKRRNERHMWVR